MLGKFIAIAGLGALAFILPVTQASAKVCKNYQMQATGGSAQTWLGARAKARIAWHNKVSSRLGRKWRFWMRSKDRKYDCISRNGRETCAVRARPCRLGSGSPVSECKGNEVRRTGSRRYKLDDARRSARHAWGQRVEDLYGAEWAHWGEAENSRVNCWRSGSRRQCRARGKPCR